MKVKGIILGLTLAILVAVISIGGTFAYLTSKDSKQNTFTIGNVTVSLIEENWDREVAENGNLNIAPGVTIPKDPKVVNTGKNPCYVRVRALIPKGKVGDQTNVDIFDVNGTNTTDWTYKNGYYYYNHVLEVGRTTNSPIFESVTLKSGIKEGVFESTESNPNGNRVLIDVVAEAIQSQGFSSSDVAWHEFSN